MPDIPESGVDLAAAILAAGVENDFERIDDMLCARHVDAFAAECIRALAMYAFAFIDAHAHAVNRGLRQRLDRSAERVSGLAAGDA